LEELIESEAAAFQGEPPEPAMRRFAPFAIAILFAGAAAAGASAQAGAPSPVWSAQGVAPALVPFVRSNLVLNGVTTTRRGDVFISYSRQDKAQGVEVGRLVGGAPEPFPDAGWNSWTPGRDGHGVFVWANALRIGPDGMLWVVDAGAPGPGKPQVRGGAKLVRIDPASGTVKAVYPMDGAIKPMSYVDDIRFNGEHAYLTDAGQPGGIIVLDLVSGQVRRVLDNDPSVDAQVAQTGEGRALTGPDGKPVVFNADQLEVSPDGQWFYYQPATGPFYRIATRDLDDPSLDDAALHARVQLWARTGATGGTAMDGNGVMYASDADHDAILRITPDGRISTLVQDPRLAWVDAMWIDDAGRLIAPAAQLDRTPGLNGGRDAVQLPVVIYALGIGAKPLRR
jgi:sugar lactone lactonase YvrE